MFERRLCGPPALALLALLSITAPARSQTLSDPNLSIETVTTGLSSPTTMAFVGHNDILVLQKNNGKVRRVLNGVLQAGEVLDVNVNFRSERGLLGIAVNSLSPPDVFLFFTETDSGDTSNANDVPLGNRVYRYDWNAGMGTLDNEQLVLDLPVLPGANHDGGILVLGPPGGPGTDDGAPLYVVIGDLNRNNQLENFVNGGPPDDTAVILRVQQDGSAWPGNPFTPYCSATTGTSCSTNGDCPGAETCVTAVNRYFAYGIRNSFGLALDPVTGWLWDTENGPNIYDEVNRVAPGFNSGWEDFMGPIANENSPVGLWDVPGAGNTYSNPEFSWFDTNAPTAILFPFHTTMGAAYDDMALVGDNNPGNLYAFPLEDARDAFDFTDFPDLQDLVANNNTERDLLEIGTGFGAITDLKAGGPNNSVYVVSISNGAIYRIYRVVQDMVNLMNETLDESAIHEACTSIALDNVTIDPGVHIELYAPTVTLGPNVIVADTAALTVDNRLPAGCPSP